MKCQNCEKPATFHITDLSGDGSDILELHLCPDCAREHLHPEQQAAVEAPALANVLKHQLKISQTAEELAQLDKRECPICGISFYEFRQSGRLGCPHDYEFFADELEPLILNVHGDTHHIGKTPERVSNNSQTQKELIRLRREMREAIDAEEYEQASEIRDKIRALEQEQTS